MNVVLSLSRRCAELRDQLARVLEEHSRQARAWSNERRWLKQRIAELERRAQIIGEQRETNRLD